MIAVLACFVCGGRPALAAGPLTNVTITGQPNGGAIVSVSFGSGVPRYQVIGAGTAQPSVLLSNTTVSAQVPPAFAGVGPIASVTVAPSGTTSARISLNLAAVTPVVVRPAGNVLFIDVAAVAGGQGPQNFGQPPAPATLPAGPGAQQTVVVLLKYADISEVAGVLVSGSNVASNDNFVPQQSNIGTSSLGNSFGGGSTFGGGGFNNVPQQQNFGGNAFGQQQGVAQRVSDNVAIDRRLNAIILTGTPDVIAALRDTIDKLDVPVPSVLLETQIVELSDTAARNVGLDLSPSGSGVVINGTGGGTDTTTGGFISRTGLFPTGQLSFSANLYAQISEGNGRVIATPRILAQSGQPASILTGDALPILTNVLIAGTTGAAAQQVNYVNVGVNLQIQPRVSSDGFVTSHIYSEVSSVTGYVPGNIPQISQRTASTIATVRDGQAIVIGGLLQENEIRNLSRLPFISDIPLIGSFFKHVSTTKTQDNLYIIVTPHIVAAGATTAPPPSGVPLNRPAPLPQSTPLPGPATPAPGAPNATRPPRPKH
ncbi:MAG: type II secretion system protein GspD [Candidatus Eremiobacteraeota bacterium]|nr:type II secretion system protein GspD [Candidatus Eremiobacteraeota bacterium]